MELSGDALAAVARLVALGLRDWERRNGLRDGRLRGIVAEIDRAARVERVAPSMTCSVTNIAAAPSGTRNSCPRCERCGLPPSDRLRRGICDRCRMRDRRARERLAG